MAVSGYFNNSPGQARINNEHMLMEDVIVESIQIMGHNVYFIPRESLDNVDMIFGETTKVRFNRAYLIEAYIANVEGFEGDGDFFSKFGLEIRDSSNFVISRRSFEKIVPSSLRIRPQEGDLIYLPFNRKIFEIRFVEHEAIFYQLGALQMYELRCELFEYSNEYFSTGVEDIDRLYKFSASPDAMGLLTEDNLSLTNEDGFVLVQEEYDVETYDNNASNEEIETFADTFIDFTERDPFSEGTY